MKSGLLFSRFFIALIGTINRFPNDWNQVVSEDHEQNCRGNLLCFLAFALQILLLLACDIHVLQGIILLLLSDQRLGNKGSLFP